MSQPPPNAATAAPYPPADGSANPQGYPPQGYAPQPYPGQYPGQYSPPPMPPANGRPPLVSIISPEDAKKIRKMQLINFGATLLQLGCSLAIILIVRNNLYRVNFTPVPGGQLLSTSCLAATSSFPGTCEYAYSLASVSIFFGFILSLMQCLTMDCCGMGRAIEAGFDAAACAWWIAGGITLGLRATEANAAGIDQSGARNAVVALCWLSAALFLVLLLTNIVLIKRLGKAYKAAAQQMQQHLTAHPVPGYAQGGVQMGAMGVHLQATLGRNSSGGSAVGAQQPAPVQPTHPPAGYPAQYTPPPAAGTTAAPPGTAGTHAV